MQNQIADWQSKNTDLKVADIQAFVNTHKSNPKWARICRTREGWIKDLNESTRKRSIDNGT